MGNDLTNLRRIRSLKLIGNINGLDFILLRNLFMDTNESLYQYPVDIDLSECNIVAGNQNHMSISVGTHLKYLKMFLCMMRYHREFSAMLLI